MPPTTPALVSVIIPTRNRPDEVARCLDSVYKSDYPSLEVLVVDDDSNRPVEGLLSGRFPATRFLRNESRQMLACSRNRGASESRGEFLFFLDDDNVVAPDAIGTLVGALAPEKAAVAAPLTFYLGRPDVVWTSYIVKGRFPGFYRLHTDVPPSGAKTFSFHNAFMVKRAVFDELHGFDCELFPIRFGEVDFAHRVELAGYEALFTPRARDWHDLGWAMVHIDSKRAYYTERNRMIVIKKYYPRRDFAFYALCILPFLGSYQLVHHALSTTDGRVKTASAFLRGVVAGLRFEPT